MHLGLPGYCRPQEGEMDVEKLDEVTARVRCAMDPKTVSPQVRGSIGEIAVVVAADWRRMMTLAEDAGKSLITVYDAMGCPREPGLPPEQ